MKATIHTVEAVIGTLILLVGVMSIYPMEGSSDFYFSDEGYNCLRYLDESGSLRNYVYNDMTAEMNTSLYNCLPKITGYTFRICSATPCATSLPANKSVFLSSYLVSGENSYSPRIINLWLWLK